jgi:hypothetical protein
MELDELAKYYEDKGDVENLTLIFKKINSLQRRIAVKASLRLVIGGKVEIV